MFSFFGAKSNAPSTSTTPTRESNMSADNNQPGYQQPETTGSSFSFISGAPTTTTSESGLFGGMSVTEDPNAGHNPSQEAGSSFSFMNSSEAAPSSGFSFMASSSEPVPNHDEPSSGFSFMSSGPADTPVVQHHSAPEQPDLMSMAEVAPQAQDLKLNKVAAQKVVKKKKKSTRVGADRDDGDERRGSLDPDNEELASYQEQAYAQQQQHQQQQQQQQQQHYHHEQEYVHDVPMDQPPPPVPVTPPPVPMHEYEEEPQQHHHHHHHHHEQQQQQHHQEAEPQQHVHDAAPPVPPSGNDLLMSLGSTSYNVIDVPLTSTYTMDTTPVAAPAAPAPAPAAAAAAAAVEEEDEGVVSTSFTKNIHHLDDQLCTVLLTLRDSYQTAQATQQYLLRQTEETHNVISSLKDRIILLETKQSNFAKQEDFEQAELVSHDIDQLQLELQQKMATKDSLLTQLTQQRQQYAQEKVASVQNFVSLLTGLTSTCESTAFELQQQQQKLTDYVRDEESRMMIDQQRVDLELNHCQREQDTLRQETAVIEEAIQVQVGDMYHKRDSVAEQVTTVQDEIRQLEEQLALKRAEEAELSKTLKHMDSKIHEVRKKYDRQLSRIHERKETLQRAQDECDLEQAAIHQHQAQVNDVVATSQTILQDTQTLLAWKQIEHKMSARIVEDLLLTSSASATTSTTTSAISSLGLEFSWYHVTSDALMGSIAGTSTEAVTELRQQVEAAEASWAQSKAEIEEQSIQHELLVTKQKMMMENIERLEIAKKLHAANKRFKEAGATAKELKDVSDAKEKLEQDIQQSNEQMSVLVAQCDAVEISVQQLQTQLRDMQRVERLEHLNHIIGRIFTTKRVLRQLQGEFNRLQEVSPTERKGMLAIAIDVYTEELNQLSQLRTKLATNCDVQNIEEYAKQLEPVEVEEEEEVVPVVEEEIVPESAETETEALVLGGDDLLIEASETATTEELSGAVESVELADSQEEATFEALGEAEDVAAVEEEVVVEEPAEEAPAEPQVSAEELQEKISQLETDMEQAAGEEEYEKAAALCDEIEALKQQLERLQS